MASIDGSKISPKVAFERRYVPVSPFVTASNSMAIRVMQWNIYAQGFVILDEFPSCPKDNLTFESRLHQIASELTYYKPDIACVQEADIFHPILEAVLQQSPPGCSYKGCFMPKTFSPCLNIVDNKGPDGLGIIYRCDRFSCEDICRFPLDSQDYRFGVTAKLVPTDSDLKHKVPSICVVCLHLRAKPEFAHQRVQQSEYVFSHVSRFWSTCEAAENKSPPLFICGDFNAEPSEEVMQRFYNWDITSTCYSSSLQSAYYVEGMGEPEYTTWKAKHSRGSVNVNKHTIDYILYTTQSASLSGVFAIPTDEMVGPCGLPTKDFPSDHMNLIADFMV